MKQHVYALTVAITFLASCTSEQATQPQSQRATPQPLSPTPPIPPSSASLKSPMLQVPALATIPTVKKTPATAVPPTPVPPSEVMPPAPSPQAELPRTQVTRFFIVGDDVPGSIGKHIENYFNADREKTHNQVYYHPRNRAQFTDPARKISLINSEFSVSQEVEVLEDIAVAMGNAVKQQKPKRAILFLEGHGAPGGNFCYQSRQLCTGTPAVFFAMLKTIDAKNKELSARQRMEHLLLLPLSCFNMPLTRELAQLISTKTDWSFQISDLHMVEDKANNTGSCSRDIYAGDMSFGGHVDDRNFKNWAATGDTMNLLTHLNSLEKYVEVRNRIERLHNPEAGLIFEVGRILNAPPVKLKDFQLRVTLKVSQTNRAQPGRGLVDKPLAAGLNTGELLDRYVPTQLQARVVRFALRDAAGNQQSIDISDRAHRPDYDPLQRVEFDIDLTR